MARALIVLFLSLALLLTAQVAMAQSSQWRQYEFRSTCIVVYDFDEDGHLEIIALPDYVIDNYVLLPSPYPPADCGFTVDYDLDGAPELVLVQADVYAVYRGMRLIAQHELTGRLVLDPRGRAFAVGNTVVFNSTVIKVEGATTVFPLTVGNKLYVVYQSGLYAVIDDLSGWRRTVYMGGAEILGVGYAMYQFYILGRIREVGSVLVVYDHIKGNATLIGYPHEFERVVIFLLGEFLATSGEYLYRVSPSAAVLEYVGNVLHSDGDLVYVQRGSLLEVYSPVTRGTVISLELPATPAVFGGRYPFIAFSDGSRTYAYVALPPITVLFWAPPRVYVGEVFEYRAYVYNAIDYTVLLNDAPVPPSGRIALNRSGVHVFTVYATNGVVSVTREYRVTAIPRPLTILLFISGVTRAYATVNLTVRVYDRASWTPSEVRGLMCRVNVSGVDYVAESWTPITVQLLPASLSRAEARVSVRCGDGDYYEETTYETTVSLYPVQPVLQAEYLGEGTLRVFLVSPDGSTMAPGTIEVFLNYTRLGVYTLPATLTGIPPGTHMVTIYYYSTVPVFSSTTYTLSVTYHEDVSAISSETTEVLHVADVVRYVTVTETVRAGDVLVPTVETVIVTETVKATKEITVPIKEVVEISTLDVPRAITAAATGVVAGITIGVLLAWFKYRKKEKEIAKRGV
ncbi:MAG: hypothetical protein QXE66_02865 [Desulfurococcaceae archaeon]